MRTLLPLLMAAIVAVGVVARPWPQDGGPIDENLERFEVFVPDGSGHLRQQMMTLKEIRSLLARQSLEAEQDYQDKTEVLSLEGGKGAVVSPSVESPTHQAEVTDVVSSVKTIMAAEMAKLNPDNEDVFVVLATGDQPAPSPAASQADKTSLAGEVPVKSVPESVPVAPVIVPGVAEKMETSPEVVVGDSGFPGKTDSVPELVEIIPEIDQLVPDVVQSVPEVVETIPEAVETIPEIDQLVPDVVQSVPEVVETIPEAVETIPEIDQLVPDVVQSVPEVVETIPETVETIPEIDQLVPDVAQSVPEVVETVPGALKTVSKVVETVKEVAETVPGAAENVPEVVETVPVAETVPEAVETVPEVVEKVPEVEKTLPGIVQTVPEVSKTVPDKTKSIPEVAQAVPEVPQSVPEAAQIVPETLETIPEVAETVPEVSEAAPVETTAAEEVLASPTRVKSQGEPVMEPVVPVETPADVPDVLQSVPEVVETIPEAVETVPEIDQLVPDVVQSVPEVVETIPETVEQTADALEVAEIVPVTEQDSSSPESVALSAGEDTSSDETDAPTVDKTLGIPDSASIVGEIPYFKSTILSASTPSLEDLMDFTDADASSSAGSVAESTEEAGSEQLSDETLTEQTEAESKDSTEAMETSEIPESTESSTETDAVTDDPELYAVEIENNIRKRPVFYQNVLPSDNEDHHHGDRHHVEHSGHDEQHHHDQHDEQHHHGHHDDQHDHHEHGDGHHGHHDDHHGHHGSTTSQVTFDPVPAGNKGLLATNAAQNQELDELSVASNNVAWKVWNNAIKERSVESNQVFSPLALTSALGIAFLGARGSSADTIDSVLGLDALTSRNPHLHLRQVTHDLESSDYFSSAMDHVVFADKNKGAVLDIFKARVDTLYGAKIVSTQEELARTVENLAERGSSTKMSAFLNEDVMKVRSPLGILSTASLKANWSVGHIIDDELQFLNLPSSAQVTARRLVPVSAVQATGVFHAGYDADLDATAAALPLYPARSSVEELYLGKNADSRASAALDEAGHLSLILLMPGSTSKFQAGGAGLTALESKLAQDPQAWNKLMGNMVPKSLQVQFPQLNSQSSLRLGRAVMAVQTPARAEYGSGPAVLAKLFDPDSADFSGVAGPRNLYLVDLNQFVQLNISSIASSEGFGRSSGGSRSEVTFELKRKSIASKTAAAAAKVTKAKTTVKSTAKPAAQTSTSTKRKTITSQKTSNKTRPSAASAASAAPAKTVQKTSVTKKTSAPKTSNRPQIAANAANKVANSTNSSPVKANPAKQASKTTSRPTSKTTPKSTNKATSKSTSTTTSKPANNTNTKQSSKTASKSSSKTSSKNASQTTLKSSSKSTNGTTTKQSTGTNSKQQTQTGSKSTSKTASKTTNKSATNTKSKVVNNSTKQPAKTTNKTTTKTSTKQPLKSASKSTSKTTSRPSNKTSNKQTTKTASKATNKQTYKPAVQTSSNSTATTKQTTTKSTSQTTPKPKQQTSNKSTSSTTTKSNSKPTTKPTSKTTSKSTTKSTSSKRTSRPRPSASKRQGSSASKSNVSKKAPANSSSTKAGRADDAQQRLVFNRAFVYAVRHNPTGMLLYIGRYVQP